MFSSPSPASGGREGRGHSLGRDDSPTSSRPDARRAIPLAASLAAASKRMNRAAVAYALLSAVLFGLSTPAAKVLLGSVHPAVLAGLLYCGAGLGIALLRRTLPAMMSGAPEASLARGDLPWLAGAIAAGGMLGPLLLMTGLAWTAASTASLLLTLEGAATAVLAWFVFHENFDRRIALGMACLVAGAAVLSWTEAPALDSLAGPLAIIAACLAWGLDNNLTRKVSHADPLQIVELKGLVAGPFNLPSACGSAACSPASLPPWSPESSAFSDTA
jgi:drug/metabolite transporter (DMT)-like permease